MDHTRGHAIVLGASMSGLINAAVLARHYGRVTLIERDPIDDSVVSARKGAPQGRHVHGFWRRGMQVIDDLLPGFRSELIGAGAVGGDVGRDFVWHQFGAQKRRDVVGIPATLMTRPFLETSLRRRVLTLPRVSLCAGASVVSLLAEAETNHVRGVRVKDRDGNTRDIIADLVVDTTGRAGLCARWLEELGYARPDESKVRIDVSYVTRTFKRESAQAAPALAYAIVSTPPVGKRAGVAFAVEGERWVVTLAGFVGEDPPEDLAGFLEYARSLPAAGIYDLVRTAEPIDEPARFKFPHNSRRHYEKLTRFPCGLLVTGDALASFNPAYGQGMTVAALEAEALDAELARGTGADALARRFFRQAAAIIDVPWSMTTGEDLRYPEAQGVRPKALRVINPYVARLHRVAAIDADVSRAFFQVAGFEARPESLFAPRILWKVLFAATPGASSPAESTSSLEAHVPAE